MRANWRLGKWRGIPIVVLPWFLYQTRTVTGTLVAFIMILSLLPIAPFDGAKAWRALPLLREWARERRWRHE